MSPSMSAETADSSRRCKELNANTLSPTTLKDISSEVREGGRWCSRLGGVQEKSSEVREGGGVAVVQDISSEVREGGRW